MNTQDTLIAVKNLLLDLQLDDSYGITEGMHKSEKGKTAPAFTFCKARILDGVVVVWSPKFIQVKWQTAIRELPHRHSQVFKSFDEFAEIMNLNFSKYVRKVA